MSFRGPPFAFLRHEMDEIFGGRPVDRRTFARAMAACAAALAYSPVRLISQALAPALTIGFLTQDLGAASPGFSFGFHEARQSGLLFGKDVSAVPHSFSLARDARSALADMVGRQHVTVIVVAGDDDVSRELADQCVSAGVVFINVASRSDDLRRSLCSPFVFQVESSNAMYASAGEMGRSSDPGANPSDKSEIVLWHSSLERYGASQLNDRYQASAGTEMTGPAWAAWMAVKVAAEAYFRTGSSAASSLASYLHRESTQFDGHKGAALSFRSWDHELRQPLYRIQRGPDGSAATTTDVPDLARSTRPAREALDTIGDAAGLQHCKATAS
jgi:hypothetical protein